MAALSSRLLAAFGMHRSLKTWLGSMHVRRGCVCSLIIDAAADHDVTEFHWIHLQFFWCYVHVGIWQASCCVCPSVMEHAVDA